MRVSEYKSFLHLRREYGYCKIGWRQSSDADSFKLSRPASSYNGATGPGQCDTDGAIIIGQHHQCPHEDQHCYHYDYHYHHHDALVARSAQLSWLEVTFGAGLEAIGAAGAAQPSANHCLRCHWRCSA